MDMRIICIFLLLLTFGVIANGRESAKDRLLLCSESWQVGPIYYAKNASEQEISAAEDMAKILERLTGLEWPVQEEEKSLLRCGIFIGKTRRATAENALLPSPDWLPEGDAVGRLVEAQKFRVKVSSRGVILVGSGAESTVQAIYWFLSQRVGISWYGPGDWGEELPQSPRVGLPFEDTIVEPSYLRRVLLAARGNEANEDWGRRNLLTRNFSFNHAIHNIVVPELMGTKPQWFPVLRGKRYPTTNGFGPNPNLANEELARYIAEEAIEAFTLKPQKKSFSISVTDNINFDESPSTLEIVTPYRYFRNRPDYSNLVFGFSNNVAESIWPLDAQSHVILSDSPIQARDKFLGALAYFWAENTPSFKVHPRVIPYLTADRAQWFDSGFRDEDLALIKKWSKAGPEIIGTWDYYEGAPYFIPRGSSNIVAESIPLIHEAGVDAFFAEGKANLGFDVPRLWLAMQLLFDTKADPVQLQEEFYADYFRESAVPMRRFYELCDQQWEMQSGQPLWIKYFYMPSQAELYPLEVWGKLDALLVEAEVLAESERVKNRLAIVRESLDFAQAAVSLYFEWKNGELNGWSPDAIDDVAAARNRLIGLPMPESIREKVGINDLLAISRPPPPLPPSEASLLFEESFSEPLFFGDEYISGPLSLHGKAFRGGWKLTCFHNDLFSYQRLPDFSQNRDGGVRFEGSSYCNFKLLQPANIGQEIQINMDYRGKVSPGSRITLSLSWLGVEGENVAPGQFADIPVGTFADWRRMAVQAAVPQGAEWAYLRLRLRDQQPGDFLEVDTIRMLEWPE